jgi:hypothetical protein
LITYANWLLANDNQTYVINGLWPVIQLDLDYVTANWNQSTSVSSFSFLFQPFGYILFFADTIFGKKSIPLRFGLPLSNTGRFVKEPSWPLQSARLP